MVGRWRRGGGDDDVDTGTSQLGTLALMRKGNGDCARSGFCKFRDQRCSGQGPYFYLPGEDRIVESGLI